MNTTARIQPVLAAAGIMILACGVALTASCRGSDQVAPEGSTITVSANPATIVILTPGGSGSSDVVATVYSAAGVPQEDQDVRFSSSAGSLFTPPPDNQPAANIPIRTDNLGNAHIVLTTTTTTTVTARSGTATGTLSLSTVNGNLNAILLNQDTETAGCDSEPNSFLNCDDNFCLVAQAVDDEGAGIVGVVLTFSIQNADSTSGDSFAFGFSPNATVTTNAQGIARATFQLGSDCNTVCSGANSCSGDLIVALQGGGFPSNTVNFNTSIP